MIPAPRLLPLVLCTLVSLGHLSAAAQAKPNFLIILADDMGFSDIGCYGGEIQTPSLDALAADGLRFTRFYNTARCWPTRSAIMSGYYPQQLNMDPPRGRLPAWARLLPHYLKPLGYRNYHSGKWHINGAPKPCADGGFDRSYTIDDHDRFFDPRRHREDDQPLPAIPPGTDFYLTTHIADRAIAYLKDHAAAHADKPFMTYLAFTSPHFPLHAIQKDIDKYKDRYLEGWDNIRTQRLARMQKMGLVNTPLSPRQPDTIPAWNLKEEDLHKRIGPGEAGRAVAWADLNDEQKKFQATKMAIHAAMVDRMDQEIGRVLAQLKAMNALENTLIFFASDNGASAEQLIRGDQHDPAKAPGQAGTFLCLGPGWSTASNTPHMLHKTYVHEGGISTPLIVHWPKGIAAKNELRHAPGHVIDIVPTILDILAVNPSPEYNNTKVPPISGRSLLAAFPKDNPIPRPFIYFNHERHHALISGDFKAVTLGGDNPVWQLYNLATDRIEQNDLAPSQPEKLNQLTTQWQQLDAQFKDQAGPITPLPARNPTRQK